MFDMLIMGSFSGSDFDFGSYSAVLKVIYALVRVLVSVVLLNLLIALMNNSFSAISERSGLEISMLRASIIVEQELLMSERRSETRDSFGNISTSWCDTVNVAVKQKSEAVLDKMASIESASKTNTRDSTDKQQTDIKRVEDQLKAISDKQQTDINSLSNQLEAIERLLMRVTAN
jgi:hypothetical protein